MWSPMRHLSAPAEPPCDTATPRQREPTGRPRTEARLHPSEREARGDHPEDDQDDEEEERDGVSLPRRSRSGGGKAHSGANGGRHENRRRGGRNAREGRARRWRQRLPRDRAVRLLRVSEHLHAGGPRRAEAHSRPPTPQWRSRVRHPPAAAHRRRGGATDAAPAPSRPARSGQASAQARWRRPMGRQDASPARSPAGRPRAPCAPGPSPKRGPAGRRAGRGEQSRGGATWTALPRFIPPGVPSLRGEVASRGSAPSRTARRTPGRPRRTQASMGTGSRIGPPRPRC